MRAKVILPAMGLAMLVLAVAFFFHFGGSSSLPLPRSAEFVGASADSRTPEAPLPSPVSHAAVAERSSKDSTQLDEGAASLEMLKIEYSAKQVAQLHQLATTGDPHSLTTLVSKLSDPDSGIRQAALEGIEEFGDPSAIPALTEAMESSHDPQEQVNIKKVIDYLQLQTLTEQDSREAGAAGGVASSSASAN